MKTQITIEQKNGTQDKPMLWQNEYVVVCVLSENVTFAIW